MQMKCKKNTLSWILCIVLIVAIALFTAGCNGSSKEAPSGTGTTPPTENADTEAAAPAEDAGPEEIQILGEGQTVFLFTVTDQTGSNAQFEIHTDQEIVGDALLELGFIEGDSSRYGLYVKTVNGITLDYDRDGVYWAFYVNDEYASLGVDSTSITEGERYSFRVE